jgi:catechol-2,3-dioxygenase
MSTVDIKRKSLTNFRGATDPVLATAKLGFVGIDTPDVERMVDYYTDALDFAVTDRAAGKVYLTTGSEHHCVVVAAGDAGVAGSIGFEIVGALDDAQARLKRSGIAAERRSDLGPGIASSLTFEGVDGQHIVVYESQTASGQESIPGVRPTKLGHVALHVADLAATQMYFEDVLGFRWSDTIGDFFSFMRCGPDHHTMNFLAIPNANGEFGTIHHVAYETRDVIHLRDLLDHISKRGYLLEWGLGRHGAGHNLFSYHRDPDGNLVELFTELDVINDERTAYFEPRPWHESYPQGPQVWAPGQASANIWGVTPPW